MMKVSNVLITLACVAAISLTGGILPTSGGDVPELYAQVGTPNPWTDQQTMEDAQQAVGFSFQTPKTIGVLKPVCIQTLESDIIQVFYQQTADSEEHVLLRKGFGSQDISGDYNAYSQSTVEFIGGSQVTLQGDDGMMMLATWVSGRFSYSVSTPGMTTEEIEAVIAEMK